MATLETARALMVGVVVVCFAGIWFLPVSPPSFCDCLQVSFLSVGQGDAIYITTPDRYEILVDGGRDSAVLGILSQKRSFFDREIDVVVATHPDADHIGGLTSVLERYHVGTIIMTTAGKGTSEAIRFNGLVEAEGAEVIFADAGQRFQIGASTTLTIFSPVGDESLWETNNASVIAMVSYGETDVLLTGDASSGVEEYLVSMYGSLLEAEILKLGHHGSKTSTSDVFLNMVKPQYAVVSAGLDNRYGHPHQEVMQRVLTRNIPTFHTGVHGTVTFISDGVRIWQQ